MKELPSIEESTVSSEDGSQLASDEESTELSRLLLTLIVKSFCPKHVSGECATQKQVFDLNGTDGHDMFPPSNSAETDGDYVDVARDDIEIEIENPKPIYVQIMNCVGILEKLDECSAQACSIFIPILKKTLGKHDLQVGQIILRHSELSMTRYDDEGGDVHTIFNDPMDITKHFDDMPITKDYHVTHYTLWKNLYPKEHKFACDSQFHLMMHYHGEDCGASSQQEPESWITDTGKRKFCQALGVAPNAMTERQQQEINGRITDTRAMNIALNGAPTRQRQSNHEPIGSIRRQTKFGKC